MTDDAFPIPESEPETSLVSWDTMHEHEYAVLSPSNENGLADVGCTRCGHGLQLDLATHRVEGGKILT